MNEINWEVDCAQKPDELRRFVEFMQDKNIRIVLEIGTEKGGTACIWAQLVGEQGRVITIDLRPYPVQTWTGAPYADRIIHIIGDSQSENSFLEAWNALPPFGRADLLFIDGDHTYHAVKDDFNHWKRLVRPGGWVAFHDILPFYKNVGGNLTLPLERDDSVNVCALWEKLRLNHNSWEFVSANSLWDMTSGGIGLIKLGEGE